MIRFRENRKRLFDRFLARLALHSFVALTGFIALMGAIFWANWVPIIIWGVGMLLLEIAFWYDQAYGWPDTRKADPGNLRDRPRF